MGSWAFYFLALVLASFVLQMMSKSTNGMKPGKSFGIKNYKTNKYKKEKNENN
jgi:hypothetical protein